MRVGMCVFETATIKAPVLDNWIDLYSLLGYRTDTVTISTGTPVINEFELAAIYDYQQFEVQR